MIPFVNASSHSGGDANNCRKRLYFVLLTCSVSDVLRCSCTMKRRTPRMLNRNLSPTRVRRPNGGDVRPAKRARRVMSGPDAAGCRVWCRATPALPPVIDRRPPASPATWPPTWPVGWLRPSTALRGHVVVASSPTSRPTTGKELNPDRHAEVCILPVIWQACEWSKYCILFEITLWPCHLEWRLFYFRLLFELLFASIGFLTIFALYKSAYLL